MTGPLHSNRRLDNNFVVAFDGGYPVQMSDCGDVAPALATFPSLNLSSYITPNVRSKPRLVRETAVFPIFKGKQLAPPL